MSKSSHATRIPFLKGSPWIISFLLFISSYFLWGFIIPCFGSLFYEVAGPSDWGTAVFYSSFSIVGEGSPTLYVRDYKKSGREIIPVARLEFEGQVFGNAVWSKDGSVVVAYVAKGDKFSPGDPGSWVGYDFKNHVKVEPPLSDQALARGGGAGPQVFPSDEAWWNVAHRPWPWQIVR